MTSSQYFFFALVGAIPTAVGILAGILLYHWAWCRRGNR